MRGTGELQVKDTWGKRSTPNTWQSVATANYDLCSAGSCVIPSRGKGTMETRLAVALPSGHLCPYRTTVKGWPFTTSSTFGAGVVDSDYWDEIKVVLFNHSAEDFKVQMRMIGLPS